MGNHSNYSVDLKGEIPIHDKQPYDHEPNPPASNEALSYRRGEVR